MSLKFNLHDCKKLTYNGKPVSKGYINGKIFYTSSLKNIISYGNSEAFSEEELYVYTSEDLVNWSKYDFDFYITSITNIEDVFFANKLKKVNDRYKFDKLIISSNAIDWNDASEIYNNIRSNYIKTKYCGKFSDGYNYFTFNNGIYKTLDFINFEYCSNPNSQRVVVFNDKLIGVRMISAGYLIDTTQVIYSTNGVDWTIILSRTDSKSGSTYNRYYINSIKVEKDICYFMMSYTNSRHDVKTKYCDNAIYVSKDGVNFNNVFTYTLNLPFDSGEPNQAIPDIKIFYSNHFYHIGCKISLNLPETYIYKFYYSVDLTNFIEIQSLSNEMNQHRWFPSDMFFANSKWHLFFLNNDSLDEAEFISDDGFTWNKSDSEKYLIGNIGNKIFFADSKYSEGVNNISITENFEDYNYCNFDIKPGYPHAIDIIII